MGKGDKQRPAAISAREYAANWCATFGHTWSYSSMICKDCGTTYAEVVDGQVSWQRQVRSDVGERKEDEQTDVEGGG